jgi:hypothetical protein
LALPSQLRGGDVITVEDHNSINVSTSMLTNTLNTNEIKNAAGTEVEFTRLSIGDRKTEFAATAETPALPNRLTISHQESGSGQDKVRRSLIRFDKTVAGQVDTASLMKCSAYAVVVTPIGNMTTTALAADTLAQLMSFLASLGASTTILYDCTGNGAACALNGGI